VAAQRRGANPSSLHTEGRRARRAIEEVREEIAAVFHVPPAQVHFTGSATEANNLASPARCGRSSGCSGPCVSSRARSNTTRCACA